MPQTIARRKGFNLQTRADILDFFGLPLSVCSSHKDPWLDCLQVLSGHQVNWRNSTCLQKAEIWADWSEIALKTEEEKQIKIFGNCSFQWCVNVLHTKKRAINGYITFSLLSPCWKTNVQQLRLWSGKNNICWLSKSGEEWNFRHYRYFCAHGKTEHV